MQQLTFILPLVIVLIMAGTTHTAAIDNSLRVMTFNVRYGSAPDKENAWPNRRELVVDVISSTRPDIIGWQEMLDYQRAELLSLLPGYSAVGLGREADGSGEQCAIFFVRDRFMLLANGTFWLSHKPLVPGSRSWDSSLPRICTWALLWDRKSEHSYYVYNSHFDHQGEVARIEAAEIILRDMAKRAGDGAAILMGDFNAGIDSTPQQVLSRALRGAEHVLPTDEVEGGTYHGFTGLPGGSFIDNVFVTHQLSFAAGSVLQNSRSGVFPSDHFPVLVACELLSVDK